MDLRVGIKETVWVRLTHAGEQHLYAHFRGLYQPGSGLTVEDGIAQSVVDDAWRRFALIDLMLIFGSGMSMGSPAMFVDGLIHFTPPS